MDDGNLRSVAERLLADVGLPHDHLVHESLPPEHFGDGEVIFRVGSMHLRFVRDKGRDFIDIGPACAPREYRPFGDVELAMGWKPVDQAWSRSEPEPLTAVLKRLRSRYHEFEEAFWSSNARDTLARLDDATRLRNARVLFHLRRLVAEAERVTSEKSPSPDNRP